MEDQQDKKTLDAYRKSIASQYGEDGVLEEIFRRIPAEGQRWCVEFGAGDGKEGSNVWNLIQNKAWSAVLIEAWTVDFQKLEARYRDNERVTCIETFVEFSGDQTLDRILAETDIPDLFDFLCIDIDGNDYHIWQSLERYRPKVVMIEFNYRIPFDTAFIQPRDMRVQWGSSLSAIVRLAEEKGYTLVYTHACNAIFVKNEYASLFDPVSPDALKEAYAPQSRFFELYDGTIVLTGVNRHRLLSLKKKIQREPVYVLDGEGMHPVRFRRDNPFLRRIKNMFKHSSFYTFLQPFLKRVYNRQEEERKRLARKND